MGEPYASFWREYRVTILATLALAAVSVAGLYVRGRGADLALFRTVNAGLAGPAARALAVAGYVVGATWFSLLLFVGLFLLGWRRLGVSAVAATAALTLGVLILKLLTDQPRPWQQIPGVRVVGASDYGQGYPSGHAAQAFLSAFLLVHYPPPRWYFAAGLYGLAGLVAFSRVSAGQHLPADVIAGSLIGLLGGLLWTRSRLWPARGS